MDKEIEYSDEVLELCDLASLDEYNSVIEIDGELYYIGTDDEWPYKDECELSYEVSDMEANYILATRKSVGTATKTFKQDAYIYENDLTDKEYENLNIVNIARRWEGDLDNSDIAFLPDSDIGIYKKIPEPTKEQLSKDYVLYNPDDDCYWCVRQICSKCPLDKTCKREIVTKKKDYRVINIDLAAQEPRCNIMNNPDERTWRQVFQNDTLRKDPNMLFFLNYLFKENFKVNTDIDLRYLEFIDKQFFLDHTKLLEFNNAVMKCKLDTNNETYKQDLSNKIDEIRAEWENFIGA